MQQRRVRLGDIVDDYCPRERRVTNHAVVAMIEDVVKQTRCTTCDADHEYKHARVPVRRKTDPTALSGEPPDNGHLARPASSADSQEQNAPDGVETVGDAAELPAQAAVSESGPGPQEESVPPRTSDDEGPVHRPLIRATLPRPEGQPPERREPDFTIRQPGGRGGREIDGNRTSQRPGHRRRGRGPGGQGGGGNPKFGGPRHGSGQRQGFGPSGDTSGNRGGHRPGNTPPRGPRPGGQGRKRGR
jgi:hypothetical protein